LFFLNVAKALSHHRLTLLSLCASREEMDDEPADGLFSEIHKVYLPKWKSVWSVLRALPGRMPLQLAYYWSAEFRAKVELLLPRHDAVLAHLVRTGQYVESARHDVPRVLLMADAISLAYKRMADLSGSSPLWHWLYRVELNRLFNCERRFPQTFDQTWLHSDIDRRFLGLDSTTTRIVPIGVDLAEFQFHPVTSGNVVAFVGNMSFSLNQDACHHFLQTIFPLLEERQQMRFRVIGACPPSVRRDLEKYPGVEVTGRVDRIADAIDGVFCGVCPLRAGAGIQNKILNYLALGIPCVTSRVGLEGLNAVDGSDLFVYEKPQDAAKLIANLHLNAALRKTTAAAGRRFVEQSHGWPQIHHRIRQEVAGLRFSCRPEPDADFGYPSQQVFPAYADAQKGLPVV
jgi:glycosyltransferase involved in cell wall biosynthesis